MKKRIISIVAILLMAIATANAQVFIFDKDEEESRTNIEPSETPFIPDLGESHDQGYVPIGVGVLVLAGLAGAYLLGKKIGQRKKDK